MLKDLTHDILIQMGINKAGVRIKILRLQSLLYNKNTGEGTKIQSNHNI